jgi:pSer/pThr/pTyr-binding forkhead associated (FHA) protein
LRVGKQRLVFGRAAVGETRAVPGADATVSRTHLAFTALDDGQVQIEDLGSGNGTFVLRSNGWERITAAHVGMDAQIRLGTTVAVTPRQLLASTNAAAAERQARSVSRYVRTDGGAIKRKR